MSAPPIFHLHRGTAPLLVSIPHAGTYVPAEIQARLTPLGRDLPDTDWFVDRLYEFVRERDVTLIVATHSRYVVDLNRPAGGGALYPGQAETGVCPTETFAGDPLYAGARPDANERASRIAGYWQPYHDALGKELARVRQLHGEARLLDGHSILGSVPRLFEGALPDLNFGTHDGAACMPELVERVMRATAQHGFTQVLNGRFKGGYITRHYGSPGDSINVMQLEMAQRIYMQENERPLFHPQRALPLIGVLRAAVEELLRLS